MKKYVISVGAGKNQLPLIKRLVERGYGVISFDKDVTAPGKQFSDVFNDISTWDYDNAILWLDSLGLSFKGVVCFSCGYALVTQMYLLEHYRLNGKIKKEYLHINTNKQLLRFYLNKFKLTKLMELSFEEYIHSDIENEKTKYIIKKKDGISSKNIQIANNIMPSKPIIPTSNNDYIIQEYIDGIEYRIISLVKDKKAKFISVMERDNLKNTFFTGRLNPTDNYDKKIIFLIEKVIEKFELIDSALKIDVIQNENRIEILEIDFGIGGDYFETIISPSCYNYNFIDNYINLMLGLPVQEKRTLNNGLCFDYIYNIDKKENLIVDYSKIFDIANNYFFEYNIVKIKEQRQLVRYPKSNMDAVFGIIHDRKDLSNYDVNILFNKALSK